MQRTVVIDCFRDSVEAYRNGYAIVAVDVIRATTTAVTAVARGRRCYPVPSIEAAVALARKSELSLLVLGETANMSGEYASRSTLELPGRQQELLEKIAALGKPVVLVIVSGRPLSISWASEHVPAIVMAWQPGSEAGNAIANILFGDANPGGH